VAGDVEEADVAGGPAQDLGGAATISRVWRPQSGDIDNWNRPKSPARH